MSIRTRYAVPVLALVALAAACTDRSPTSVQPPEPKGPEPADARPLHLVAITCRAEVKSGKVDCDPAVPRIPGIAADLTFGGQNVFIRLTKTNGAYAAATQEFSYDVRVRNLIPQALGTADGVTLHAKGVNVFFQSGPTVTAGTGQVTVNSDGMDLFTSGAQHYFRYNQVLQPFAESGIRKWSFTLPPTVLAFTYTVYVSAAVQYPDGWVDVEPSTYTIRPTAQWKPNAIVRTAVGTVIPDQPVVWTTADTTIATVNADGVVTGVRGGSVSISATSGPRTGSANFLVTGIQRHWTGAVSSDWHNGANWSLNGVVPGVTDTAVVPSGLATPYPVLVQNALAGDVVVENSATIALSAFDLTTVGNVTTGTSGGISSTSGRLNLGGVARTVAGVVPLTRVTGTYSLVGNLTVSRRLEVNLGRLTNTSFRVQQNPF